MSDGPLLRLPHSDAAPVFAPASGRRLAATAVATLTSEVSRHPGPKRVLVVAGSPEVTDFVLDDLMPADRLVIWATDPALASALQADLAGPRRRDASRVTVVTEGAEIDEESVDVAVVATPITGDADSAHEALDRYRSLLRADGVLSVATGASPASGGGAAQALQEAAAAYGVRSDLVVRNRPPLRIHHLRFSPADPALAERLEPAYTPSHVAVSRRMGIDSNGVAAAGIFGGLALLTRLARPRSKAWLLPAVAALPVAAFFRDPRRITPTDPAAVVAASDGVVLSVERVKDDRFGTDEWLRIAVFLSVLDVHVNRSPVAGRVVDIIREEGGYAMAQSAAAEHNVAQYTVLETTRGRAVVAQRTGLIARRIVNRARIGSLLSRGERYGLIRFGSRTDVYLPADLAEPMVAPGDRVVGAETVIARYV
jgi:phosphatidylserine decarboxylase